jgi:hypothetical protein
MGRDPESGDGPLPLAGPRSSSIHGLQHEHLLALPVIPRYIRQAEVRSGSSWDVGLGNQPRR